MSSAKEIKLNLIKNASLENPDFSRSKKQIGVFMISLVAMRLFYCIVETAFCLIRLGSIAGCVQNYAMLFVLALFVYLAYNGSKGILYLILAGSFISPLFLFSNEIVIENLKYGDIFYNFYVFSLVVVSVIQLVICVIVLTNKKYNLYFLKMNEISKTIMAEAKQKNIKN